MARELRTVGVVGLGTMGAGIAEVFARHGLDVVGVELDAGAAERGRGHLRASTDRMVKRGKLTADEQETVLGRVTVATELAALADCDLVIEAVVERLEVKRELFGALDRIVGADAILATNTSSLSVTEIAVATGRPERVVGMHFFNPAPVQRLVEVIRTVVGDPEVAEDLAALARRLGKTPVTVTDRAGFIANALLFGYLNRAMTMLESGYATREDLDAAMRLGAGYPMGPFALLDMIGLDTAYEVLDTMYRQTGDRLHAPTPLLRQLVTAGLLGRKTGRGFYTYEGSGSGVVVDDDLTPVAHELPSRPVSVVAVVGSGPLAAQLAEDCGRAGYDVRIVADGSEFGDKSARDLAEADLLVDTVGGCQVTERLGAASRPGAVLATTDPVTPVIELAMASGRPADVVGLNVTGAGELVEVTSTVSTAPEVTGAVVALVVALGKHPLRCGDRAGRVVDALVVPYLNDAVRMLEAGYASADDVDAAMTLGCRMPAPFEVLDTLGLDVALTVQRRLYAESREPGLAPAPLLDHLVTAGRLGRRTGEGFRKHVD